MADKKRICPVCDKVPENAEEKVYLAINGYCENCAGYDWNDCGGLIPRPPEVIDYHKKKYNG
jgi:hypothetical protein